MKILIAGAGIGGLTAALCFEKAGHEVVVFEQASGFLDIGACLLYTSPSPRDLSTSRMPSSA